MADGWFDSVLESTPARLLLGGMPYMATRERQMEQEQAAKTFGGLLDQERMQMPATPVSDQGPIQPTGQEAMLQGFKGPGGLLGSMPQSSFYLDVAAKVPQLTGQIVSTAQQQQAAMDRQVQEQTYRQSNMSAAEFANHTLQQERMRVDNERFDQQFNGLSAYQKALLGRMGGGGGGAGGGFAQPGMAQIGAVPAGHMMTMDPVTGQPVLTPLQGGEQWRGQRENVQKLNTGVQALDEMINFVKNKGSFETGAESGRVSAGPRQAAIAGLAALNNMGVLQPGELAILEQQLVDPNAWSSLLQNNSTALGKLQGVRERFVKASKDAASRTPGAASAPQPPAGFR